MVTQRVTKYIADLLPLHCEVCQLPLAKPYPESGICHGCADNFSPVARCLCCGLPTTYQVELCGECLKHPPHWRHLYCVGDYCSPLSDTVQRFKYQRQFWRAKQLANILAPRIQHPAALLTSVPLHWRRYLQRGFNQSELLAMALARELNVPYRALFNRVRATPNQQGLSKAQRQRNLHHAFALKSEVKVEHVAIIDDVVTTGSTVQQLCDLLLDAGVKSVDIYCICRTPEPSS